MLNRQAYFSSSSKMITDPNQNKYQENQMLFFQDKKQKRGKDITRPRTVSEIKKLQNFVKSYKTDEGKSLNNSIKKLSQRDESFNEFFRNFKAKNEQGWANVVDMTQEDQEDKLLHVTPEMRKN
jgi:ribosomal protein S5